MAMHPRKIFERKAWTDLNGEWTFKFDEEMNGQKEKWYEKKLSNAKKIIVPFTYESEASTINDDRLCNCVWYEKEVDVKENQNYLLHFGAIDYRSYIYINGELVKEHVGGFSPIDIDLENFANENKLRITVCAIDEWDNESQARGKQSWIKESKIIWYKRTTGIWQNVWLEEVYNNYIVDFDIDTNIETGILNLELKTKIKDNMSVKMVIHEDGQKICETNISGLNNNFTLTSKVIENKVFNKSFHGHELSKLWSPENPKLFDIEIMLLKNEEVVDHVLSYCGFRKIEISDGRVLLNNKPYFQKLVLNQGFWKKSIMTPPNNKELLRDILVAKKIGFNGFRVHQKIETSNFYYFADKYGMLIWEEMPSAITFDKEYLNSHINEWTSILNRDKNHPCIITLVPFNESWGIENIYFSSEQQHFAKAAFHLTKTLSKSRIVLTNDGWENIDSDIIGIHNYNHGNPNETDKFKQFVENVSSRENLINDAPAGRKMFCKGYEYQNQPLFISECCGISYSTDEKLFSYSSVKNAEELAFELKKVFNALNESTAINGYCITQLTDVEQEKNGLLDDNHKIKSKKIYEIM